MSSYDERFKKYKEDFGFKDFGINNIEKLRLISLFCYLTQKLREKDKTTKVIDVVNKIIPDSNGYGNFLENISFVCESLLDDGGIMKFEPFPTFGYKDTKEIVNAIRQILTQFLPF